FTFGLDSTGALHVYVPKSSSAMHVATGTGSILSGQWVQVAFTWDGTVGTAAAAHVYVNGVEQTKAVAVDGSGTLSYANATNKSFRIGNNSYLTTVGSLNGKVAYLAVYRGRVLTGTELNQLDGQLPIR
ncbi:MAG TPA: LamG-like jellyroll fold domain-containing protein, partial [Candidatus Angelobacter sp.]|nr:LamG-like jellyroll fold domain-containing protein [Candidatus Angelobacter sp.]